MNEALIHEIVVRFRGGASMRHIAQSLGINRRTVKRVLDQVEQDRGARSTEQPYGKKDRRGSQLDAHLGTMTELLARYPSITAQRIYAGSVTKGATRL
jgi:transposase